MLCDNVETIGNYQKFGSQEIYYGSTAPSSPGDGALWYESNPSGNYYSQPWIYNSSNTLWLSNPFLLDFGTISVSASTYIEKSIPFYGVTANKTLVRQVVGITTNLTSTAHDSSNYYSFAVKYTLGTATPLPETTAYSLSTNTGTNPSALAGNASRRILENPSVFLPGNAWSIRLNAIKTGSPSNIYSHFGLWVQFGRS